MTSGEMNEGTAAEREARNGVRTMEQRDKMLSIAAGGLLTLAGLSRGGVLGAASAAVGSGLLVGGLTGKTHLSRMLKMNPMAVSRSASVPHGQSSKAEASTTIERPREELYRFWRNFENLVRIMDHVESVRVIDEKRSQWEMKLPTGRIAWTAEIINEIEGEVIAWRSIAESDVDHAGSVRFKDAPGGRGTMVTLVITYAPPMGVLGSIGARLLPQEPEKLARESLRHFKWLMETGEIPTSQMRPGVMANKAGKVPRLASPSSMLNAMSRSRS